MKMRLLVALAVALVAAPSAGAWTWPAAGPVLRPFVFGDNPYLGGQHRGIDVRGAAGSTVQAPAGGRVAFAGTVPTGKTVTIQTADGYSVTLVQLGSIGVGQGLMVREGDPVGTIGPSGVPEHAEPYVHLGIRVTADPQGYVDPLSLLPPKPAPAPPAPAPLSSPPPPVPPAGSLPAPPAPPATGSIPAPAIPVAVPTPAMPPVEASPPTSPAAPLQPTVPVGQPLAVPSPAAPPLVVPSPGAIAPPSPPPADPAAPAPAPSAVPTSAAVSSTTPAGRSLPAPPAVGELAPVAPATPVAEPLSPVPGPLIDPQLPSSENLVPAPGESAPEPGTGQTEPGQEAVAPAVGAAVAAEPVVAAESAAPGLATEAVPSNVEAPSTAPASDVVAPAGERVSDGGLALPPSVTEPTPHRSMGGRQADAVGRSARRVSGGAVRRLDVHSGRALAPTAKLRALSPASIGATRPVRTEGTPGGTRHAPEIGSPHPERRLRAGDRLEASGATSSEGSAGRLAGFMVLIAGLSGLLAVAGIIRRRRRHARLRLRRAALPSENGSFPAEPVVALGGVDLSGVTIGDMDDLVRDLYDVRPRSPHRADVAGSLRLARRLESPRRRPEPRVLIRPHVRHVRALETRVAARRSTRDHMLV